MLSEIYAALLALQNMVSDFGQDDAVFSKTARELQLHLTCKLADHYRASLIVPLSTLSDDELNAIQVQKNKIQAIKLYRTRANCSLKQAKDFIEQQILHNKLGYLMPGGYICIYGSAQDRAV